MLHGMSNLLSYHCNDAYSEQLVRFRQQENIQGATKLAPWTGSDGIITEGQEPPQSQNNDGRGFKGTLFSLLMHSYITHLFAPLAILIRSLGIAHGRAVNTGNTAMLSLIQAYINVQVSRYFLSQFLITWHSLV